MSSARRPTLLSSPTSMSGGVSGSLPSGPLPTIPVSLRRDSAFSGDRSSGGAAASFLPLLKDPASMANERERAYYQREEEKIYQIVAQMEKGHLITEQMLAILDSFDDKLSALESSMLPIHKGTQALTTAQKNIDSTLVETDKIILHYSIATESEDSINSHLLNSIDYVTYLEWVEKIHLSINFFAKNKERLQSSAADRHADASTSHNSSSTSSIGGHSSDFEKYLKRLKELNKRVMQDCEHEFERVLHAASKNPLDLSRTGWPLPPVMSADGQSLLPFHVVPELSVRELGCLAGRMAMAGNQNYFGILLAERSAFIRATLKKIFHEEVRFVVNSTGSGLAQAGGFGAAAAAGGGGGQQIMQMRGSIIQSNTAGYGGLLGGGDSLLAPPQPPATPSWGAAGGGGALTSGGGGLSGSVGGASQLYIKNSHRSVFYLDFFLKLLELENQFLLPCLQHIFSVEELRANGLATPQALALLQAREDSMLNGAGAPSASSGLKGSSSGASHASHSGAGSSGANSFGHAMSLSNLNPLHSLNGLTTSATTGNLQVFWGQEAYDAIFGHIVDAPLEYFKKKIEQNTYLNEKLFLASKIGAVFGVGSGASGNADHRSAVGNLGEGMAGGRKDGLGGGSGSSSHSSATSSSAPNSSLPIGITLSNKILILLDVLEHLNQLLPRYRLILKKHVHFEKLTDFQAQITSLARKSIQEYREYIVEYSEKASGAGKSGGKVQKDGTIYTLTVETLNFIKRLYEYRGVIEHTTTLVDKHHAGMAAQAEKDRMKEEHLHGGSSDVYTSDSQSTGETSPLTRLVSFLLTGLEANMDAKARGYKLASLSAIFLLNNFHYASRFLRKNESTFLQPGPGNLVQTVERYDKLVHTTMKQYRTVSWEKIVAQSLEPSDLHDLYRAYAQAAPGSSNHKAARKAIKNKFNFFNQHFDELYHSQRYFSVPDSDLRSQLRNDNVELIVAAYKLMYDTFKEVDFSSSVGKYMKYTSITVESMINKFFDETVA